MNIHIQLDIRERGGRTCGMHGGNEKCTHTFWLQNLKGSDILEILRHIWKDNIIMDSTAVTIKDLIKLALDMVELCTFVNMVMTPWIRNE
jgi:hypothetical protein